MWKATKKNLVIPIILNKVFPILPKSFIDSCKFTTFSMHFGKNPKMDMYTWLMKFVATWFSFITFVNIVNIFMLLNEELQVENLHEISMNNRTYLPYSWIHLHSNIVRGLDSLYFVFSIYPPFFEQPSYFTITIWCVV